MSEAATPVTILTGFLGAGKTTLLKRLLADPQGTRFGVLVNDFGAINIDAGLIVETGADTIALSNGCICCSLRDDLVAAVEQLLAMRPAPQHILLEGSGVSRPLSILAALEAPRLAGRVTIDATICLVDATAINALDYAMTELAIDQAATSDLIALNKCDLATREEIDAAEATLRGPMPDLRILRTAHGDIPRELLFGTAAGDTGAAARRRGLAGADEDHGAMFEAWSWSSDRPIDRARLEAALSELPGRLLRAKGVMRLVAPPGARAVVQLVGRRRTLQIEPQPAPAVSELVALGPTGSIDEAALQRLFDGCRAGS